MRLGYYVTCVDGQKTGYLAGPFAVHGAAVEKVDAAKKAAQKADAFSLFYAFGTARVIAPTLRAGVLNPAMGVEPSYVDLNDPEMQDVWETEGFKAVDTGEACPYPADTTGGTCVGGHEQHAAGDAEGGLMITAARAYMSEERPVRPEWVCCISTMPGGTLPVCGGGFKGTWIFQSLTHATLAVEKGTRLVPCVNCMTVLAKRAEREDEGYDADALRSLREDEQAEINDRWNDVLDAMHGGETY